MQEGWILLSFICKQKRKIQDCGAPYFACFNSSDNCFENGLFTNMEQILMLVKMIYFVQLLHLMRFLLVIFKNHYLMHLMDIVHLHLVVYLMILEQKRIEFDMEHFMHLLHIVQQNLVAYIVFVKKEKE